MAPQVLLVLADLPGTKASTCVRAYDLAGIECPSEAIRLVSNALRKQPDLAGWRYRFFPVDVQPVPEDVPAAP